MCSCACLTTWLTICLLVCLSTYLAICLSRCLFLLYVCFYLPSLSYFSYIFLLISACLYVCFSACLLPICLHLLLCAGISCYLCLSYACLYVCISLHGPVFVTVFPSVVYSKCFRFNSHFISYLTHPVSISHSICSSVRQSVCQ